MDLKENQNFMEHPLFVANNNTKLKELELKTKHGIYNLTSSMVLPIKIDRQILDFLLSKVTHKSNNVTVSKYEIAQYLNVAITGKLYDRIDESFNRWLRLLVTFTNCFYENRKYKSKKFRVIISITLNDDDDLVIGFNPDFIKTQQDNSFYKVYNVKYKGILTPLSARLYELLIKRTATGNNAGFNIKELGNLLTISASAPSKVYALVEKAVDNIFLSTDLKVVIKFYDKKLKNIIFTLIDDNYKIEQQTELIKAKEEKEKPTKNSDEALLACKEMIKKALKKR